MRSGGTERGILLCDAGYYGTLAAARSLGRVGVPVIVADHGRAEPALWSRHVVARLRCPPIGDTERFVEWLLEFGQRQPGHVLYPTSDELCFVLSLYRDDLAKNFALYEPALPVLSSILDKGLLMEHARAVGLDTPETWLPDSEAAVENAVREARGMILMIKPRTQILLTTHVKGALVPADAAAVQSQYARFVQYHRYGRSVHERLPAATRPMLQRFYPEALEGVYSLAGFRDRSGSQFAVLGANKVLQRPRTMGVGLCFEAAPVEPQLAERVEQLLVRLGYYGVFEVEFIRAGGRWLVIDFNPRFYAQIALDIVRGMPLPQLAYAAASGDEDEVARLIRGVPRSADGTYAFCNLLSLKVLLGAQLAFGAMNAKQVAGWRAWYRSKGDKLVDAVADPDDPQPYAVEVFKQLRSSLLDPRTFWRIHRPRRERRS